VSKGRGIDGMLVTKWDTVDDKVSPLLRSIHYADADIRSPAVVGWRGLIYDIRDRAANRLCWDRTGMRPVFRSLPRSNLMNVTDIYGPETVACCERCTGHS
jgi:hypothetical protein